MQSRCLTCPRPVPDDARHTLPEAVDQVAHRRRGAIKDIQWLESLLEEIRHVQ